MAKYVDQNGLAHFWGNIQGQIGNASQEQVNAWLDEHPEATTTVQDGSITTAKLADGAVTDVKLAQTGGVLDSVDAVENVVALGSPVSIPWVVLNMDTNKQGIYYDNGNIYGSNNFTHTEYIDVSMFSRVTYKQLNTTAASGRFGMAFYDESQAYISGERVVLGAAAYAYTDSTIDVPSDAKYARFTIFNNNAEVSETFAISGVSKLSDAIDGVANSIDKTLDSVNNTLSADDVNISYVVTDEASGIKFDTGESYGSNTFRHTDYVDVSAFGEITYAQVNTTANSGTFGMAFYDESKTYIVGERCIRSASAYGYSASTLTVPSNAKYARFTMLASDQSGFYLHGTSKLRFALGEGRTAHLRWLTLGNSYSVDCLMYVPMILEALGVTCEIVFYERDGLSLDDLYRRWESTDATDTETGDWGHAGTRTRRLYYIDTRYGHEWQSLSIKSAKACVEEGGYDFITLQQYSGYAPDATTYEPYLTDIITLISESIDKATPLAWIMGCSRPTRDDSAGIFNAVQTAVMGLQPFDFLIPYGTAIFNARTNTTLAAIGDYTDHNLWYSDGVHLQEGLPRYIAALATAKAILDRFLPEYGVLFDKTRITDKLIDNWIVREKHTPIVGISESNCLLAQKAAVLACNHPFTITQM